MWEQLSTEDRDFAGPLFGIFIAAFLRPDTLAEMDALESAGFSAGETKRIVEETHDEPSLRAELWRAAAPTVHFMRGHGLLEHAATQDMLSHLALTPPTG
jgi:hypothetical protein